MREMSVSSVPALAQRLLAGSEHDAEALITETHHLVTKQYSRYCGMFVHPLTSYLS